jgi:ankyrin repeat protein
MIGHTALHWVASKNHEQLAIWLLSEGLPVNVKNNADSTPLHAAAQHGHMKLAQILLDAGADPTARNDEDETPAALAERRGHAPMVALLEQRRARTAGSGLELQPPSRNKRAWIGATVGVAALLVALAVAARSRHK